MFVRKFATVGAGLASLALMDAGCRFSEPNPNHCFNNEGDEYCAARNPDRPYCERGQDECITLGSDYGCVATRPIDACYSPCGGRATLAEDGSCVPMESSSSGSSDGGTGVTTTTMGSDSGSSGSTTGPLPCMGNEECTDPAMPYCSDDGVCVDCGQAPLPAGDEACAELDPMTPLCAGDRCVECTEEDSSLCDEQLLLCDGETNACAPCTQHAQCEAGACDISEGRCFDPANVLHVGLGQTYTTIGAALDDVGAMMLDPAVLVLHAGVDFNEIATVDTGVVAFVAFEEEQPQWINSSEMAPTLTVTGEGTRVYIERVRLSQNGQDLGLSVGDNARVDVRRSQIVNNSGGGVLVQNGAELTLRNCFVGGGTEAIGVEVDASSASIIYSTITANTFMATPAFSCSAPLTVDIRNSIIVSQGGAPPDELSCAGATVTNSATEADVGPFNIAWFTNYNNGDFHLTTMGMPPGAEIFVDRAQWQTGDPATDIDGDPRPMMVEALDYAGADIPPR